jgi:hypothetical protein
METESSEMNASATTLFIAWMPYFTIAYPLASEKKVAVGKAILLPDTDENWHALTGNPRPRFLDMFRDFPVFTKDGLEEGPSLRGTLITCEDSGWLEKNLDSVTAIVFFLATDDRIPLPAERFTTFPFYLKPRTASSDDDLVRLSTKDGGSNYESSQALRLTPPLAVRGPFADRRLVTAAPWAVALLSLVASAPEDRLIVAVRQYFRTQFADVFTSPFDEDYALHCSALEAAMQLTDSKDPPSRQKHDSCMRQIAAKAARLFLRLTHHRVSFRHSHRGARSRGLGRLFATELAFRLGKDSKSESFFKGLYEARSLFVHGANVDSSPRSKDHELFDATPGKSWVLQAVTRHIIRESLSLTPERPHRLHDSIAIQRLHACLYSESVWQALKKPLTQTGAKDSLLAMHDSDFAMFAHAASAIRTTFRWQCVTSAPSDNTVCAAIRTCALAICALTPEMSPIHEEAIQLGKLATSKDLDGIEQLIQTGLWRNAWPSSSDRYQTLQVVARGLAQKFDRLVTPRG